MNLELVRVDTADGLTLDGALWKPPRGSPLPVDACLLVHGTGSNFYAPGVLEAFARQAVADGTAVLRINTRGHDGSCSIHSRTGAVRGGATFETIADCRFDLRAWIELLVRRGFNRLALVGHSMGGVKAILAAAHDRHPAVSAIIAISPPRFCHDRLGGPPSGEMFRAEFNRATELVAAGQPEALLAVTQPVPFIATAAGYLEKYGPEDRYDVLKFLPRVQCPVLVLVGGRSLATSSAFAGLPDAIRDLNLSRNQVQVQVIEGANTGYTSHQDVPYHHFRLWLTEPG